MNRADFPIFKETVHGRPLVYLDNAATSQKPQQVLNAIVEAYSTWNSNIHRGVHHLSQVATSKHEGARQAVADFINAKSSDEIVFTKGTTDSLNALAFSFGEAFVHEGDEIIVSGLEHHSNIVPWQMLCERKKAILRHIPLREDLSLDLEAFKGLLSEKTKLVSVAHVSNVLGTIQPIEEIIRLAHEKGALVCIDGAQNVPHRKVDVQALDCDFMAFSGHKMFGPMGIGVLYGKSEHLEKMKPFMYGGEMIQTVHWDRVTYAEVPHKFEAGTVNVGGAVGLAAAIGFINEVGWDIIEAQEEILTKRAIDGIKAMNKIRIIGSRDASDHKGIVTFCVEDVHPHDVADILGRAGVCVRAGHHCAQPLMDFLGVKSTCRASFAFYNTEEEVDRFLEELSKVRGLLGYGF